MLLATDLDGTFLAGDPEDRLSLYQTIAAHPEIKLAYVTGRSLEAVLPLLADPTIELQRLQLQRTGDADMPAARISGSIVMKAVAGELR